MTITTHRLAAAQFDQLASGWGDLGGDLLAGQLSKRLLQLEAAAREVRRTGGVAGDRFADSYRLLAELRQRSGTAVDTVLATPQLGAWAAQLMRRLTDPGADGEGLADDLGHLGAFAAAAALVAGEGFDLTLRIRADGTLMIRFSGWRGWAAGRAGARRRWPPATASSTSTSTAARCGYPYAARCPARTGGRCVRCAARPARTR